MGCGLYNLICINSKRHAWNFDLGHFPLSIFHISWQMRAMADTKAILHWLCTLALHISVKIYFCVNIVKVPLQVPLGNLSGSLLLNKHVLNLYLNTCHYVVQWLINSEECHFQVHKTCCGRVAQSIVSFQFTPTVNNCSK